MKQLRLLLRPSPPLHRTLFFSPPKTHYPLILSSPLSTTTTTTTTTTTKEDPLTAKEKRQLRNERRERKSGQNWREQVEEKLLQKPKSSKSAPRSLQLNLDTLADLGPQWWVVRVSRLRALETADLIARLLARNFPDMEFKVYAPSITEKKILKNGTVKVNAKLIFPGCVFLWCVLDREKHDFIREVEGVGCFVGAKVGNNKRQINRPRPVAAEDMEAMFKQAKEEQEKCDRAFEQEHGGEMDNEVLQSEPKRVSKKTSDPVKKGNKHLVRGSAVRIVSGSFADFVGQIAKVDRKNGKATVGITIFGKESSIDLDLHDIVAAETT